LSSFDLSDVLAEYFAHKHTILMLRWRGVSSLLLMLVLCASVASARQKTVLQLVANVKRGDKPALQQLIMMGTAGNAEAQSSLGLLYEQGNGVPKDYVQAVNWYRKAADQGDPEGEFRLGGMYFEGHGVSKDAVEVVNWYRKAAEQGFSKAQFNLGVMYSNGDGVPKDHVQAANWYNKAAERGPS
jgi:TPR repeat protein